MESQPGLNRPRKRQRVSRACDFCHRRGLKCRPQLSVTGVHHAAINDLDCLTCVDYGQQCTRLRQVRKRGTKPRGPRTEERGSTYMASSPLERGARDHHLFDRTPRASPSGSGLEFNLTGFLAREKPPESDGSTSSSPGALSLVGEFDFIDEASFKSREIISFLIDIYLDSIYPLYPFFCETELLIGWRDRCFPSGRSYYLSLISMCALSAHHADNGALFTNGLATSSEKSVASAFLKEALRVVPLTYEKRGDIDLLRSYGLLALVGMQTRDTALLHRYLGLYHGLAAHIGFHTERHWPTTLSHCEKETWRRVFWAMYRLEVHSACVLGHIIRIPEGQTFVDYPCGIHHAPLLPGRDGKFENWFAGWNFTSDLYRILEHALIDFRAERTVQTTILWSRPPSKVASILQQLSVMQSNLKPEFAQAAMRTSDSGSNRCGFQVANILSTIHLVKMIAFASEEASFGDACQTAQDLVDSMSTVPLDYIRAFSTLLLQELSGSGHMLTSLIGRQLSSTEHLRLREILLSMADFIESLKECIDSAANEALRLRNNVVQIDRAISQAAQNNSLDSQVTQKHSLWMPDWFGSDEEQNPHPVRSALHLEPSWALSSDYDVRLPT